MLRRKHKKANLSLSLILLCSSFLFSQTKIDFSNNRKSDSIDYSSFYPALMLKHNIGPFYKLPKNPVLSPSRFGWDSQDVADPFILVTADSIFLYYDGSNKGHYSIGYAVRDEAGWGWINRKQILQPDDQKWRSFHLIAPTIIPGKENFLIYNGNESDSELGYKTGIAKQNSNGHWAFSSVQTEFKSNQNDWDFAGNAYQDIVYLPKQKIYKMWFSGFFGPFTSIGLAESTDGIQWVKKNKKPVFESAPGVIAPEVIYNGESFKMYFTQLNLNNGFGTEIKSIESIDGESWKNVESVLKPQSKWEAKRLMRPNISFFEEQVHLFYCAQKGSKWQIGEAIADAFFKPLGLWQSNRIINKYNYLIIKYEMPALTDIRISLQDLKEGIHQIADIKSNRKELRLGVYKSSIVIDKGLSSFIIEIELSTENETQSPIIYEILLKE